MANRDQLTSATSDLVRTSSQLRCRSYRRRERERGFTDLDSEVMFLSLHRDEEESKKIALISFLVLRSYSQQVLAQLFVSSLLSLFSASKQRRRQRCQEKMATVVATSEEDPVLAVVRFSSELAWADAGPEVAEPQVSRLCLEAQDCLVMERYLDLVSLMLTSADLILPKVSDKDFECIVTVICNLVTKAGTPDEALEMAKLISSKLAQHSDDKPQLRLKMLFSLYNMLENPYSRFVVYMKALEVAVAGKLTDSVVPSFKKIDAFLSEWNIGKVDQRALFHVISNILKDSKSMGKESFTFLSKYLATFSGTGEDAVAMNEVKEDAVRAIVEFIRSQDQFRCDLLEMPAVTQLEKDEKHASIYELLKIFLTKRLDAYLEFHSANSAVLQTYGLVHDECISKMRLITLLDLAFHSPSAQISYSDIRDSLQINDEDVEYWIVKAITLKLLDCKMDQMSQTVIVSRHTDRIFGLPQWNSLRSKLSFWRGNIASAISTIQANKISEEQPSAAQGLVRS
ncbi:Eukaryotic translation initiation factor 3 subunit M [Rhynchospora pubera]|uniref:Eukaryotic translation initiation factor 3 subunit M n=1 Tax=Rhynchospora pubera TaxID=906938 RepID=A0AAV8CW08_9POAL|nr:Eukaryotic translation initiation factor 3 subunit M [Rhynchospora pubera]